MARRKVTFVSYSEFKTYIRSLDNVLTSTQWVRHYTDVVKPLELPYPSNPARSYADQWPGWSKTTKSGNIWGPEKHQQFPTLAELRGICHQYDIQSLNDYYEFVKNAPSHLMLPTNPFNTYGDEWTANGNSKAILAPSFLTYKEASKKVQKYKFPTQAKFRAHMKENKIAEVPYNPHRFYFKDFISWDDFLGIH